MPQQRRGQRSFAAEFARLPEWATALLATLRALPLFARANTLRVLRFLHDLLEAEWDAENPPPPVPVKIRYSNTYSEDVTNHDAITDESSSSSSTSTSTSLAATRPEPPWSKARRT